MAPFPCVRFSWEAWVHVGRWRAHACQLVVMENDRQWEGPLTQQVIDKR